MGAPEKIAIATRGYRCPEFEPEKIAISTYGYRCDVGVAPPDRRDGDGGHGAVILEPSPYQPRREDEAELALLAVLAIEVMEDG